MVDVGEKRPERDTGPEAWPAEDQSRQRDTRRWPDRGYVLGREGELEPELRSAEVGERDGEADGDRYAPVTFDPAEHGNDVVRFPARGLSRGGQRLPKIITEFGSAGSTFTVTSSPSLKGADG